MARRLKLLTGLSTIAVSSALALSACGGEGEGEGAEGEGAADAGTEAITLDLPGETTVAAAEGEGEGAEGEGEGSEGEGEGESEQGAIVDDRVAYFARLMLISGHLRAGVDAYGAGEPGMALEHMRHPEEEIYLDLKPSFEVYDAPSFDEQLMMLYRDVKEGEPVETVKKRLIEANAAIGRAADAASPTPKEMLLAASYVLRAAGEEYDRAVDDKKVINVHEYQDAYGFMTAVKDILGEIEGETPEVESALRIAREKTLMALEIAPSPIAPEWAKYSSSAIYGAAAEVELAALALE